MSACMGACVCVCVKVGLYQKSDTTKERYNERAT